MLTTRYKSALNRWIDPFASVVARSGISPSAITLAIPLATLLLCLWFVQSRAVVLFCLLAGLIGGLDGLDGAVARASGRVTKFGAYLDALCDRCVEAMVALATAVVTGYWLLAMLGLIGSLLVSYAKARAAMEVTVSNLEWPDMMERTERGVLFLGGLAAGAAVPWQPLGRDLFWWALIVLDVLVWLTVVQRVQRAHRLIVDRSPHH